MDDGYGDALKDVDAAVMKVRAVGASLREDVRSMQASLALSQGRCAELTATIARTHIDMVRLEEENASYRRVSRVISLENENARMRKTIETLMMSKAPVKPQPVISDVQVPDIPRVPEVPQAPKVPEVPAVSEVTEGTEVTEVTEVTEAADAVAIVRKMKKKKRVKAVPTEAEATLT